MNFITVVLLFCLVFTSGCGCICISGAVSPAQPVSSEIVVPTPVKGE